MVIDVPESDSPKSEVDPDSTVDSESTVAESPSTESTESETTLNLLLEELSLRPLPKGLGKPLPVPKSDSPTFTVSWDLPSLRLVPLWFLYPCPDQFCCFKFLLLSSRFSSSYPLSAFTDDA